MRIHRLDAIAILAAITISACSSSGGGDGGSFSGTGDGSLADGTNGVGYSLIVGDGFTVSGSVFNGTDTGPAPATGSVTYNADYQVVSYQAGDSDFVTTDGTIALTGDFDAQTLTGTDGDLTVTGSISTNILGGSVTFDGMSGNLNGVIGADRTAGYFGGTVSDAGFAGAFLGTP